MNPLNNIAKINLSSEQQMLVNRMLLALGLGPGCYYLGFSFGVVSVFFAYFLFSATVFVMQKYAVLRQEQRWIAAIVIDAVFAFVVMSLAPAQMSIYYPVLLWMILSNGFRFGIKWLLASSLLSTLSFGLVVTTTAYWQQNLMLGAALIFALVAIPAYCSTLIRNIFHAKEEADLASKAKSYFLASVSHELRTPLNAIIGYGNHLRQSNMPRGQKDMVEASVLAGEHLLHLIEQLIDVAKVGTGRTEVKRTAFRATDLLSEIRDIMAGRVEEKGLALRLQAEPMSDDMVEGPANVIRNILLNLVGNAAKFTEAGSIAVSCNLIMRNNKTALSFAVSDTGIGIADTAVERIFQPFQQADETVMNRFGGTGLGLSICKQLAEQVDGVITVESKIGQGSVFRIDIPIKAIEGPPQFDHTQLGAKINILSVGEVPAELLANMQSQENIYVQHVDCNNRVALIALARELDLKKVQIVLVPEHLSRLVAPDDEFWTILDAANAAPILVTEGETVQLGTYGPAFTTALTPSATFLQIRSALRIGRAFARKIHVSNVQCDNEVEQYRPRRVLVADDNRTNRNVLAAILETAGHYVTMATDGDEALAELEKGEVDILLLDVNMPRLSGIDACILWRQKEDGQTHMPIIGVTADATTETETKCLEAGMDLRITKPVDAKLLLSTIERYCADATERPMLPADIIPAEPGDKVVSIARELTSPTDAIDRAQISYLRSIGDQAFVNAMIEGFFEDVEQTLEPLRNAVNVSDATAFRFSAHAFKSSGNNMGAHSLSHLCGALEKISEADFANHKSEYLAQIEHEVTRAVAELKSNVYSEGTTALAKAG